MLTRSGVAVAVAAAVLLAVGWKADYPELVALAFTGLATLLAAASWMFARPDLSAVLETPQRVGAGKGADGVLTVTNKALRRSPPLMATVVVTTRWHTPLPSLDPGASVQVYYPLPTQRRGIHRVGPLTIGHTDPLRLMRFGRRECQSSSTLVVYPKIHPVEPVPTGYTREVDGPTSGTAPQGGVAFHSLREYEFGDDWRLIHWQSTARTGTVMVRHNVAVNELRLMVVLDTSASPYSERSFEEAASAAMSLCDAAVRGGYPVQLRTTAGVAVAAGTGGDGVGVIQELLAGVQLQPSHDGPGDPGLAALAGLDSPDEGVALWVVTGLLRAELLAVRPRFLNVRCVQFAEEVGTAPAALSGVVTARGDEEFAAAWNHRVRR